MKIVAIIPARMGSSRFPGKPLIPILGVPMIEHVRRRVEQVKGLSQVWVATCDEEIREVVEKNGGKVVMTSALHERATERIEEAAQKINADVFINVQGDEPMVSAKSIEAVTEPFKRSEVDSTCLVYPIEDLTELTNDNIVKCVLSRSHRLLYLSRTGIPGRNVDRQVKYFKQSGIMAFRKDFLHKYVKLSPTPLEAKESVDVLRILENDYWMQGVVSLDETKGVDVPAQVKEIEKAILDDPVQKSIFEKWVKG